MKFHQQKKRDKTEPVNKIGNFISETKNYHLRTLKCEAISTFVRVLPIVF